MAWDGSQVPEPDPSATTGLNFFLSLDAELEKHVAAGRTGLLIARAGTAGASATPALASY
jgi:hypothetical protein